MTLPILGGVSVGVQRTTFDRYNDPSYTDSHIINGCLEFIGFSTTGRPSPGTEVDNAVQDRRTVYAPIGSDVLAQDRVIIFPTGMTTWPASTDPVRRTNTYQVIGRPMEWINPLNGWAPGMEIILTRVS